VRAYDRRQLIALEGADIAGVTREVFESAIRMGVEVLGALGVPEDAILSVEQQYRDNDKARLDQQIASGNLMTAKDMMFRPGRTMAIPDDKPLGDNA